MDNDTKTYELIVEPREIIGKDSKKLRREQLVPAVVYGHDVSPTSVQVPMRELERVYLRAGNTTLVDLRVGSNSEPRKVFIHDVQRHPVSHNLIHVDFMAVNLLEKIMASIPLVLTGESPAVTRDEGMLMQPLDSVQIRALPTDLPPMIEVDVSGLEEVDQSVYISDLQLPSNVELVTPSEELVVKVAPVAVMVEEVVEEAEAEAEEAAEGEAEAAEAAEEGTEGEAEGAESETEG